MLAGIIGGWELVVILAVLLLIPVMAIVVGLIVFLIIRASKTSAPTTVQAPSRTAWGWRQWAKMLSWLPLLAGLGVCFLAVIMRHVSYSDAGRFPRPHLDVGIVLGAPLLLVGLVIFLVVRLIPEKSGVPPVQPAEKSSQVGPPRKCPQCGSILKADVPEGLCPACLLQHGIATEVGAPPGTPAFTPPPLTELAKLFPQLEILEVIGQGGMGAVYKARQPSLDRLVALKILAPRSGGDLDFAGRFSREARALAKLNHPNIVGVYDYGTVGQASCLSPSDRAGAGLETGKMPVLHYFIMEFVDGPNLRQVERAGKLSPREALEIIPQICAALQFAHDEGIVHRDIKPENVLLDKKGRVKIADFGLAKILGQDADFRLTGARDVMGTPHYMAPEQVEKPQEVDHRADIYSLGVVFYEMLTGELPLGKFDPPSHKVQIDVRVDDVVLRSLANNPDRRYQHVSEVKTELDSISQTTAQRPAAPQVNPIYRGVDYRSKTALFGLPLVHITNGVDPATGKVRVSKGIIAIGGRAQGVVAIGGLAMGGLAIGGGAIGVLALGGAAVGIFSLGGLAVALVLALGGGVIAPIALGGGAIGYMVLGGGGFGAHVLAGNTHDPVAQRFFGTWGKTCLDSIQYTNLLVVAMGVGVGVGAPAWIQRLNSPQAPPAPPKPSGTIEVLLRITNIVLAMLLLIAGWSAYQLGIFFNSVFFLILIMVPVRFIGRLWQGFRGMLELGFWHRPWAAGLGKYRWQLLNRLVFWALLVVVLEICMVPPQFDNRNYAVMRFLYLAGAGFLILSELFPARRIRLAMNVAFAIGSLFMINQLARIYWPQLPSEGIALAMPVHGEWLVLHGGPSSLINNHYLVKEQRDALDIEKLVDGHERSGPRGQLSSYPSWNETVFAPADGIVVTVKDDVDDNLIGVVNPDYPAGNNISIDIGGNRFVLLAHLRKGSILVSTGQVVKAGEPLARCGNSGYTSHPHLHIQVQDAPSIFVTGAPDAVTYPILFRDAKRVRGSSITEGEPFFVRRNDKILAIQESIEATQATTQPTNPLFMNDPRLKSAITDAQERIQKRQPATEDEALLLAAQPPVVVETFPISGARNVSAGEAEIRVRFSKPMEDGSWSWSTAWENSAPEFISAPHYENDGCTCIVKVRLEPGRTYAWWLNSDNFHNFKDRAGHAAVPYLLIFQTKPK
jgi:serine/threonine protein kinase